MAFDEKIAQLRKSAGMSQEELAQELNISRQAIYKWETGQSLPDIENLKLLAQIFRVSIDSLLNDGSELAQSSALSAAEPQYGEVTRSSLTPADVDAERDNLQKTDKEKKLLLLRKIILIAFAAIVACTFVVSFICITFIRPINLLWGWLIFIAFICGLLFTPMSFYLFRKARQSRSVFFHRKEAAEIALKHQQYWFECLQPDLLAWFFFDPRNKVFGFFFNDREQFVCPIQNYNSFELAKGGSGTVRGDNVPAGGAAFDVSNGSISPVVVGVPSYIGKADYLFQYSLHYYDMAGSLKEYAFLLTTERRYYKMLSNKMLPNSINHQIDLQNQCSFATVNSFNKIKNKLESEKKKLN